MYNLVLLYPISDTNVPGGMNAPDIASPGIEILSQTFIPAKDFNATSSKYFSPITSISATS